LSRRPVARALAAAAAVVAAVLAAKAAAQSDAAVVPAAPQDPAQAKIYALFDRLCARCHQAGKLESLRPARGFANVLDLAAVAADPARVRPGNPDGSPLYTVLQSRLAPHNFADAELSGDDLDAVREWLRTTPPSARRCVDRTTVDSAAVTAAVGKALADAGSEQAKSLRFLSLAPLYNSCAAGDAELKAYGEAVGTMVNSLSWGLEPYQVQVIDPAGVLFKIDLTRIGWTPARWEQLVAAYPYAASAPQSAELTAATDTAVPIIRADWFVATAGRAPLYYELLGLPERAATLQTSLRIDLTAATAQSRVRRIGIRTSRIARGQRLIQRTPFANGAYWNTYEYAQTPGRPDLFEAPGGPGSRGAPKPDASLSMFSLPSGFNAFFIANGDGNRLADLPVSVLRDDGHAGGRVTVGAGCLACHRGGPLPAEDELRARVQGDTSVPRDIRDRVVALHASNEEAQRLMDDDRARVAKAVAAAGLTPGLMLEGRDPASALSAAYEAPLSLTDVALEFAISPDRLKAPPPAAPAPLADFLQRLAHGPVPRRLVEARAFDLHQAFVAPPGTSEAGKPLAVTRDDAEPFELVLKSGRTTFASGDTLVLSARASEACYLTLINVDRNGRGTVVFPNDFDGNNQLEPGKEIRVPPDGAPYQFRLRDKGRETIVGICLAGQKAPAGIRHDFERQRFTELGDYRAFLRRTAHLELEERKPAARAAPPQRVPQRGRRGRIEQPEPAPPRTAEPQARTAIQITVE
jgi:mono/diheme cytochrome c family protein